MEFKGSGGPSAGLDHANSQCQGGDMIFVICLPSVILMRYKSLNSYKELGEANFLRSNVENLERVIKYYSLLVGID